LCDVLVKLLGNGGGGGIVSGGATVSRTLIGDDGRVTGSTDDAEFASETKSVSDVCGAFSTEDDELMDKCLTESPALDVRHSDAGRNESRDAEETDICPADAESVLDAAVVCGLVCRSVTDVHTRGVRVETLSTVKFGFTELSAEVSSCPSHCVATVTKVF